MNLVKSLLLLIGLSVGLSSCIVAGPGYYRPHRAYYGPRYHHPHYRPYYGPRRY